MKKILEGKRILITGGTGSLGKVADPPHLERRGRHPAKVIIFSRDESQAALHPRRVREQGRGHG